MREDQNIQQQELTPAQRIRNDWNALLEKVSYKGIVNNIPYLAFVAVLILAYISNSQQAISTQREMNKEEKQLKELRWKYMDIKSKLMSANAEGEIIRRGAAAGLKPLVLPPYKIEVDSNSR